MGLEQGIKNTFNSKFIEVSELLKEIVIFAFFFHFFHFPLSSVSLFYIFFITKKFIILKSIYCFEK